MNNPISDKQLVNFLKQYRPNLPEAAPDLEPKILAAIESNEASLRNEKTIAKMRSTGSHKSNNRLNITSVSKWAFPSAIAAGLLFFWSGYRALDTAQLPADEAAHLEAFLVTNWEGVVNDSQAENLTDRPQTDWLNFPVYTDSEQPTTN